MHGSKFPLSVEKEVINKNQLTCLELKLLVLQVIVDELKLLMNDVRYIKIFLFFQGGAQFAIAKKYEFLHACRIQSIAN